MVVIVGGLDGGYVGHGMVDWGVGGFIVNRMEVVCSVPLGFDRGISCLQSYLFPAATANANCLLNHCSVCTSGGCGGGYPHVCRLVGKDRRRRSTKQLGGAGDGSRRVREGHETGGMYGEQRGVFVLEDYM